LTSPQVYLPPWIDFRGGYVLSTWLQAPMIGPQFRGPESSFVFGATDTGKSRLLVRKALMYRRHANAQIIDAFGAENDSESTVWVLAPETRDTTLMVVGNEVDPQGWDLTMPISEFTLEKAKDYDVIITDRALFGPVDERKWNDRYYAALAKIFELVKRRKGQRRLLALMVREAWNLIYSQIKANISRDEQEAMQEFRKLHNQRAHSNVATLVDTQRYTDFAASVRTLTDYQYIKGFGSQPVPSELEFLFKPWLFGAQSGREWMMRNTPLSEFIVLTKRNGVGYGTYADIPWHVEKGYSPLDKLGITFPLKPQEASDEKDAKADLGDAVYVPTNNDQHRMMQDLHDLGLGYEAIANKMTEEGIQTSWEKVRYHLQRKCACVVTTEIGKSGSEP
jgi:hypothetical protein